MSVVSTLMVLAWVYLRALRLELRHPQEQRYRFVLNTIILLFPKEYPMQNHPLDVVQRQLAAYNAKDMEGLLATYAVDAEQYTLHGERLAKGHEEMRPRFLARFAEPHLNARLISRTVMGNVVVDLESITRNFPEGAGTLEMLCIYEITNGLIQKVSFASGEKRVW
jgi:putative hydrolase of HD superfamily